MNQPPEDIKRWTARRKAAAIMEIIKGKTTAAEIARSHDLTIAEIDQWMDDFVSQGTEALRSHPRDAEPLHKAEKKELLAKIGDLTIQIEVLQIARKYLGKTLPGANSWAMYKNSSSRRANRSLFPRLFAGSAFHVPRLTTNPARGGPSPSTNPLLPASNRSTRRSRLAASEALGVVCASAKDCTSTARRSTAS